MAVQFMFLVDRCSFRFLDDEVPNNLLTFSESLRQESAQRLHRESAERVRQGCSKAAARLRRGEAAERLRKGCGKVAARLLLRRQYKNDYDYT